MLLRNLFAAGILLSCTSAMSAERPRPEIRGHATSYTFETDRHFDLSNAPGAYYNEGVFPTLHMGVACQGQSDPNCRRQTFDHGRCFLTTAGINLLRPGRVQISVQYLAQAIRDGWNAQEPVFDGFTSLRVEGTEYPSRQPLLWNERVGISRNLSHLGNVGSLPDGRTSFLFGSQGVSNMTLFELSEFRNETEVDNLKVSFCAVDAVMFAVKSVHLTVIQD